MRFIRVSHSERLYPYDTVVLTVSFSRKSVPGIYAEVAKVDRDGNRVTMLRQILCRCTESYSERNMRAVAESVGEIGAMVIALSENGHCDEAGRVLANSVNMIGLSGN